MLGIGTSSPIREFHLVADNPRMLLDAGSDGSSIIRFTEGVTQWYGGYIGYDGTNNYLRIGMHNYSGSSTAYDVDILTIDRTDGRMRFYPQTTVDNQKTLTTFSKTAWTNNYVIYKEISPGVYDQTFCVQGRGWVYCLGVTEESDFSSKENINTIYGSLNLLMELRPVSYNFKADVKDDGSKPGLHYGLIAQEVEKVIPDLVDEDSEGTKGLHYSELTAFLIQALQEQQAQIDSLKMLIKNPEADSKKSVSTHIISDELGLNKALLYQNAPNPFNETTTIKFEIPVLKRSATINVYDLNGKQLRSYPIYQVGLNSITVDASTFSAGIYIYNLIVDGNIIDSKQMILTN